MEQLMNCFRPFSLIERTMSEMKSQHWPFKGSWKKSGKRGVIKARQQWWARKAKRIVMIPVKERTEKRSRDLMVSPAIREK